ncbi:MAG: hypothetical protein Ct9H300mP28_36660 [Pseudomonadota bacterium]|nr:MAG: hypothetical protein Ct9H300mP28_36660 [Pseudomonadota bacterium]
MKELDTATNNLQFRQKKRGDYQFSGQPVAYGLRLGKAVLLQQSDVEEPQQKISGSLKVKCLFFRQQWIILFLIHWN